LPRAGADHVFDERGTESVKAARLISVQVSAFMLALFVSSFVVHSALYVAPGNPITVLSAGRNLTPEGEAALVEQYNLDDPFLSRYVTWLTDIVQGNMGTSILQNADVSELITPRLSSTLLLLAMASFLMVVFGVGLGLAAGLGGRKLDAGVRAASSLGIATPSFVAAIVLIAVFSVGLGWFPVFGSGDGFFDEVYHLILPAIALALAQWSSIARVTRISVRTEADQEHVETARSRGLSESGIIRRHVLRNAMIPISTIAGLTIAGTIAATVVVETAFALNGLGALLVDSVTSKDFAVVQAVSLIYVAFFLVVNMLVDLGYVLIDPRIRTGGSP
jgi:peptide/nickel transport system permease protein